MKAILTSLIVFLWLSAGMLVAGDICLIDIRNDRQLQIVERHLVCAHGMIDSKFIVVVNDEQRQILQSAGVNMVKVTDKYDLRDLYLVSLHHPTRARTAVSFAPIYSTDGSSIVPLAKSSVEILDREGYMARPLAELRTPFFYRKPMYPALLLEDYPADTLADLVVLDSLHSYDQRLEDFYTRFTPTDSNRAARDWIRAKFQSFGYDDVSLHAFLSTRESMGVINVPAWNVICKKIGTEYPDDWIVIGGHYDSYSSNDYDYPAPGADDDATGVAAALELARIFHDLPTKKSYMFCGFGAEEQLMDGTDSMAAMLHEQGVKVEFVLNIDMIAWEEDGIYEVNMFTTGLPYYYVFADAAARLGSIGPVYRAGACWDAGPFVYYGAYGMTFYETDDYPWIHTGFDLTIYLDFDYMTEVVKTAVAAISVVDASVVPFECQVYDVGDGQTVKVVWDNCLSQYSYKILYGHYVHTITDTVDVPAGQCEYYISGLTEGQNYYFAVYPIPDEGYPPLYNIFSEMTPLSYPRAPSGLTADPILNGVSLIWDDNNELDFDHYKLLRRPLDGEWTVLQDQVTETVYVDYQITSGQEYVYTVLAFDNDLNESDSAAMVNCFAATFDQGILLVEETQAGGINPSTAQQNTFYNGILANYTFSRYTIDSADAPLSRSLSGQYDPVFYVDDDNLSHFLSSSLDTLKWYLGFDTDFFLAGWETIYSVTGNTYFYEGDFFHDQLGLTYVACNILQDFAGATGEGDWPDLELKPETPFSGRLPNIQIFGPSAGAEVIARFNSYSGNPYYDNKPVGVAYDNYQGKRVILGCPLYWLTEASAQALVDRVMTYFAAPSEYVYGDVNEDRIVNLLDITYLIAYLYQGGPPPVRVNHGDPNSDCTINILDVVYLIGYLYNDGPAPVEGCVQ